jgi:glycosyltransferase involved in cell wall biosynthesis
VTGTQELIALASYGDPYSPKTWSGTPRYLMHGLRRAGASVIGIDSSIGAARRWAYRLLHRAAGYPEHPRARRARSHSASLVTRRALALGCTKVLHTGSLDLPDPNGESGLKRYLLCDSTWDLWSRERYPEDICRVLDGLEREAYMQVRHFFPESRYVRDNLVTHYGIDPDCITVVGTGRGEIEPFTGEKDYANSYILFVAKERFADKGGPLLLDAFKLAQAENRNLKLVVVGDDRYREKIGDVANVTVTGRVSWDRLQELFNKAALFAMPALNEPWGLVYIEALVCRTPVLGLNRNAFPEIAGDGKFGFVVDEPTPAAVAEAILDAFSAPERLREMGHAGQAYCLRTYSWDNVAKRVADVMLSEREPRAQERSSA